MITNAPVRECNIQKQHEKNQEKMSVNILSVNWRHIHWPSFGKGENKGMVWYGIVGFNVPIDTL